MYEFFYNLSARPFQLMPDPRLLFESKDHKRALSYLLYGLERREGFVVITGDVGMGKTLLVQRLLGEPRTRAMSVARVAMANLDAGALLPTVASAFGLPHKARSKIELLDDLVSRLLPSQDRGAMLIVDEAQTCTAEALEELRAISNLQANGRALLQIFLVGQTDLRQTLSRANMGHLRQRIVASHHLHPLDSDEVRAYIQHRLRMVGWADKPTFTDEVYTGIHDWSRGVPRRINLLMDRFLLYGYLEQLENLTAPDLQVVVGEFEEEFSGDNLATGDDHLAGAETSPATANSDLNGLNARLDSLEQSLASALGRVRAAELIDQHQAQAESQAVLAAQMRLARLESLVADLAARPPQTQPSPPPRAEPPQPVSQPARVETLEATPQAPPQEESPWFSPPPLQAQPAEPSRPASRPSRAASSEPAPQPPQEEPAWFTPRPSQPSPPPKTEPSWTPAQPARAESSWSPASRPAPSTTDSPASAKRDDAPDEAQGRRARGNNLADAIDSITPSDVSPTHRGSHNGVRRGFFSRKRRHDS
jgi:type II secretory pathway predicted ATPase ExeA